MECIYITFRSVTYAQKGQRALDRGGIRGTLMRAPRWMEPRGCAYALKIRSEDRQRAMALLQEAGVPWERIRDGRGEAF